MASAATITHLVPRALLREAERLGLETAPLWELMQLDANAPASSDVHVDAALYHELWDRIVQSRPNPGLAIRVAKTIQLEDNEVFGFLAISCKTLGEAFARTARYRALYNVGARWELEQEGARVRLTWLPWSADRSRAGVRAAVEFALANMNAAGHQLTGIAIHPTEVRLAHPAPSNTKPYVEFFGVEPRFDAPHDELTFDASALELPITSFNSRLRDYFDEQCRLLAARFVSDSAMAARVRAELITAMDGGDSSMASVSRRLGLSERSLQRRLAEEDTRFDALVDDVRREFAERYLAKGSISASEVAYLVGFRSPTAFFRAFKRWTGGTPGSFQRSAG